MIFCVFIFQLKSQVTKDIFDLVLLLFENYDPTTKYNVSEYLTSFGLSVDRKYRGRSIGDHFLSSRKTICREFGLKFTQTIFSSDFSNVNADKAGFQTDVVLTYVTPQVHNFIDFTSFNQFLSRFFFRPLQL